MTTQPTPATRPKRLVVGVTGATGSAYALRILRRLRELKVESHLVVSAAGVMNLHYELDLPRSAIEELADKCYAPQDIAAAIASGSFPTDGMIVAPCSMKTLAAIAHGFGDNLISRAADVTLKERRKLILMVRETPFNLAHLRNMVAATEMGAIIFPPMPAHYHRPASADEAMNDLVERVLSLMGVEGASPREWQG